MEFDQIYQTVMKGTIACYSTVGGSVTARIVFISPRDAEPPLEVTSFKVRMPRYGALSVASYLSHNGHKVRLYDEYVGTRVDWNEVRKADFVCLSVMSFSALRAYAISDRVRSIGIPVIMGGSHPSVVPEDALDHADFVVRNEGEETLLELIETLQRGADPVSVAGVSYRGPDGKPVHNPDRAFLSDLSWTLKLDLAPEYRPDLGRNLIDILSSGVPRLALPVLQATRGCPFGCRFCFVKYELGRLYRKRPIEAVLADADAYLNKFKTPYLFFVDNDLTLDPEYSEALFSQLLDRYGRRLRPFLFSRLKASQNDNLLRVLEQFDRTTIGVGIESIFERNLQDMNKGQTVNEILSAIETFRRYRINLQALFIFGSDHDTPDTILRTVDFCVEQRFYNIGLCSLYDFPSRQSVLGHEQMIPDHLFIHRDWRFFSGNFVVHFPKWMRPSQLQRCILDGYDRFYDHSPQAFYQFNIIRGTVNSYIKYLERIEKPFYDARHRRNDDDLKGRTIDDLSRFVPLAVPIGNRYREARRFYANNLSRGISWDFLQSWLWPGFRTGS